MKRIMRMALHIGIASSMYLMMIFYPEKIEPFFNYFFSDAGLIARVCLLNLCFISLFFMVRAEFIKSPPAILWRPYLISYCALFITAGSSYAIIEGTPYSTKYLAVGFIIGLAVLVGYIRNSKMKMCRRN